jgi:uncharacterized protein
LTIDPWATSNVPLDGHRVRLDLSGSNYPRYDRNSHTGGTIASEREANMVPAHIAIDHDAEHPSRLILPVIDRCCAG